MTLSNESLHARHDGGVECTENMKAKTQSIHPLRSQPMTSFTISQTRLRESEKTAFPGQPLAHGQGFRFRQKGGECLSG